MFRVSSALGTAPKPLCRPPAAFLEGFKDNRLRICIDPVRGQRQSFRYPAAGIMQNGAKRPDLAGYAAGRMNEGLPLIGGQIQALAGCVIEVHLLHFGELCNNGHYHNEQYPVFLCQENRKPRSGSPFHISPWRRLTSC